MANENILSDELVMAARNLEERFQILRLPVFKVPRADWHALPAEISSLVPPWLRLLLSDYILVGAWLELEISSRPPYVATFTFFAADNFARDLKIGGEFRDLIRFGYIAFANEEGSGSVWVASTTDGASGKIYLLEHTGWDGSMPTETNGLVYAHKNLACLLAAMAVSNANNYSEGGQMRGSDGMLAL